MRYSAPMSGADDHYRKLERMYASAPLNRFFCPEMRVSEGTAEVVMPVRTEFFHAAHAVHGAVYFKMLDDAAFFAANSVVTDVFVVTVSYNVYITRPITEGVIRAHGRVVHRSRNLILAEAQLENEAGEIVARGSGSFLPSRIALSADIGYV